MNRTWRYVVLIPLSALAFWALFIKSGHGLRWPVGVGVLVGAWFVWYLLWKTLHESAAAAGQNDDASATISPGEQRAWVGLLFSAGILIYFAQHHTQMVAADGSMSVQARAIGSHIAMLVIFGVIVMRILRQRWRDSVEHDERDRIIQSRANSVARIGLTVFVIALAVLFAFSPLDRLTWAKPMTLSNVLMFGLIISSVIEYAVIGISYWRDRV